MKCTFNKNSWGLCMFKKKNKFTLTHTHSICSEMVTWSYIFQWNCDFKLFQYSLSVCMRKKYFVLNDTTLFVLKPNKWETCM